jgi:hypothetical protein
MSGVIMHAQAPFANVGAGNTAIISQLDQGDTCHALLLKLGGTFTKAQIDEIRVKLGGKTIVLVSGSQLDVINKYLKRTAAAAYLPIWFADPNARTINGEDWGSIDLSIPYKSFSIEVDINSGATNPTLECFMLKSPGGIKQMDKRAIFRAYLRNTEVRSAAGTFKLEPPLGSTEGVLLTRLHMFHANLTHLQVKKDGSELMSTAAVADIQYLQNELNRSNQSGHLCWDAVRDNNQSNSLSTLKDGTSVPAQLYFNATLSGSDTINEVAEVYATIDRV